ncbi:hypothetical protein VPH35_038911 [Triticum aestivum]|uniref:Gnk2-homologous domain-containing protein n=1 Tax=Aegilops tauschii subsp. strangulata TaxID=200361 RepID=A0A453CKK3_AEGTS
MALSRRLLLFLSLVAVTAVTGTSEIIVTRCYPPPTPAVNGSTSAFRRDLLSLLDALPSAAAPTGFASMRTGGAFARGLCFGDPAPDPCFRCLSDAGRKITDLCGHANRRAGFLDDGCFLGYSGANASSAGADDDDISGVTFSGDALPLFDNVDVQKLVAVARSLVPRSANGQVAAADATATASNGEQRRHSARAGTVRDGPRPGGVRPVPAGFVAADGPELGAHAHRQRRANGSRLELLPPLRDIGTAAAREREDSEDRKG